MDPSTPFNKAIAALIDDKDDSEVFVLLKDGLNVNYQNACGASLLHMAAIGGQQALADNLLQRSANPNIVNWQGQTPVFMAANWSENGILLKLLESGGDPNIVVKNDTSIYNTPLLIATVNNNVESVKILVSHGGDISYVNTKGISVSSLAKEKGFLEILELSRND
ncbi:hypothetical protein GCM10007941_16130 [Amphritea balenae]|nr:hypothetical protein GCM10007941_16130 [Amphritea balenae]